MILRILHIVVPVALTGLLACARPPSAVEPAPGVVADTIRAAMNAYMAALRAGDPAGTAVFYDTNLRVFSGPLVLTYDSVLALEGRATRSHFEGAWDTVAITLLGRDSAEASGSFWQVITDSAGVAQRLHGRAIWRWVRRTAGWRVLEIRATTEAVRDYNITPPNQRMDRSGRGRRLSQTGTTRRRTIQFPDLAAAPQVMRGR